jgi:NitT/TauT family transport system permease protein
MTKSDHLRDYAFLFAGLLLIWGLLYRWAGADSLSSPSETLRRAVQFLLDGQFWGHAEATGIAFAYGCLVALFGGLVIGFALGANRAARDVGEPILTAFYSIPKITLYPVILLIFGLGVSAKVAFGALHGLFPVAIFTIGALKNTAPVLLKTALVLRLSAIETARTILLPAALPEIVTGLRIGFSSTLLGTLIGELFASDQGIGFLLIRAMEANRVSDIMALTLMLFAFAGTANVLLLTLEHRIRRR